MKMDEVDRLMSDSRKLRELLLLEKKRRGFDKDSLTFIGMANLANYYWCAMKSYLTSKQNELEFFSAYLEDRIRYSQKLGYIKELPEDPNELLKVGEEITFKDIEKLFKEREDKMKYERFFTRLDATEVIGKDGKRVLLINPELSNEEKEFYEEEAKGKGVQVTYDVEKFPKLRGGILEFEKAEKYPTIRWNFKWNKYVVIGVPDGITNNFVYEFKSTRNKFLMYYIKPVAFTQADLYSYFFKRNYKRVQIYVIDEDKTYTWTDKLDKNNAEDTLKKFKCIDEGETPVPPKRWKCKHCEFRDSCPIRS